MPWSTWLATLLLVVALLASSTPTLWEVEHAQLAHQVHAMRSYYGLPPLPESPDLSAIATDHSWAMAKSQSVYHSTTLSQVPGPWSSVGENVAAASRIWLTIRAMMDSPPHRALILGDWTDIGYGHIRASDGRVYVTLVFRKS